MTHIACDCTCQQAKSFRNTVESKFAASGLHLRHQFVVMATVAVDLFRDEPQVFVCLLVQVGKDVTDRQIKTTAAEIRSVSEVPVTAERFLSALNLNVYRAGSK